MNSFVSDTSSSSISLFIATESRQKHFPANFPTAFTSVAIRRTQKIIYLHTVMRNCLFVHNWIAIIEDKQWNNCEGNEWILPDDALISTSSRLFSYTLHKVLGTRLNLSKMKIFYLHLFLSFDWSESFHLVHYFMMPLTKLCWRFFRLNLASFLNGRKIATWKLHKHIFYSKITNFCYFLL